MSSDYSEDHILYQAGRTAMERNDLDGALTNLKRSAEIFPHFKTYECIGECLLKKDKPTEAVAYLEAAVELGNKQFRPLFLLAKALIALGEIESARNKLEQALSMNPNYKAARDLLMSVNPQE